MVRHEPTVPPPLSFAVIVIMMVAEFFPPMRGLMRKAMVFSPAGRFVRFDTTSIIGLSAGFIMLTSKFRLPVAPVVLVRIENVLPGLYPFLNGAHESEPLGGWPVTGSPGFMTTRTDLLFTSPLVPVHVTRISRGVTIPETPDPPESVVAPVGETLQDAVFWEVQ